MWTPDLSRYSGHRYLALADAIGNAIANKEIKPGERLPPHRWLADRLGITTATVAHGYRIALQRGLLTSKVGSGTRVVDRPLPEIVPLNEPETGQIDMGLLKPALIPGSSLLQEAFSAGLRDLGNDWTNFQRTYAHESGYEKDREFGAALLRQTGLDANAATTVVCQGAQQAFLLLLTLLTQPGDCIMLEAQAYLGIKNLCKALNRVGVPLEMDAHGVIPEALEGYARRTATRIAVLTPSCQNPTGARMTESRRERIAQIALKHDLLIVEDNPFAGIVEDPHPTLSSLIPERCFHIRSLSKLANPALRIAYMSVPRKYVREMPPVIHSLFSAGSSLDASLASQWISRGIVERLETTQAVEVTKRWRIANTMLEHLVTIHNAQRAAPFLWISPSDRTRVSDLAHELERRDILAFTAERFTVGRGVAPNSMRLSLTTPESVTTLVDGLESFAQHLQSFG